MIGGFRQFDPEQSDEYIAISALGTPVYSNLEFRKVSGTSLDNSLNVGAQQNNNSEVMLRIDTVLITVTGQRNITKTDIQGRDGSLKEYISNGDYIVNVKGSIVSEFPNVYPEQDVKLLIELLRLNKSLPVASKFLDMFGISYLVIDPEFTVSEQIGSRNEVPFEFNALSDFADDFELSIS